MKALLIVAALAGGAVAAPATKTPVIGRVVGVQLTGGETVAVVAVGSNQSIDKYDTCSLFREAEAKTPIAGDCVLVRVDKTTSTIKTSATLDAVKAGAWIKFVPHDHP